MTDEFKKELEQLKKQHAEQKDEKAGSEEEMDIAEEFAEIIKKDEAVANEAEEKQKATEEEEKLEEIAAEKKPEIKQHIFALRTTANREDQVMDFVTSNAKKRKLDVHSVIRPHGMRGYIFLEAPSRSDAEQ